MKKGTEDINLTLKSIDARIFQSDGHKDLWSAQIGRGYYHWNCPRPEAIENIKKRVLEIVSNDLKRKLK